MTDATDHPVSKAELLAEMRSGRMEWDALIAGLPDEALIRLTLPNGWSIKDLMAHVAAYEHWTAVQISAATEGRTPTNMELYGVEELPPPPSGEWDEAWQNAAIYEHYKETPLAEVRAFAQQAFNDLVSAIEAVPEEDVARKGAQRWAEETTLLAIVPEQSYGHYRQHIDDLRTAIASEG